MTTDDKKEIVSALKEHIDREELHTSEVGKYLNLNPMYISLAKNEKHWDGISKTAWDRLEEWFLSRGAIKDFQIPEGEDIYKPKEKLPKEPKNPVKQEPEGPDEHSPEAVFTSGAGKPEKKHYKPRAEKPGKSVKLIINQAEMSYLRQRVTFLEDNYRDVVVECSKMREELLGKVAELQTRVNNTLKLIPSAVPVKKRKKSRIVIFQRNIYKS